MDAEIKENYDCSNASFRENIISESEAIFSYKFENISKLEKSAESPPCYLRNLPWRILVMTEKNEPKLLSIFLQCNAECDMNTWSCQAQAEIRLLPVRPKQEIFVRKIKYLFNGKTNDWGFKSFIAFKELLDPDIGYVNAIDDSVTIEIYVIADVPQGNIFWDSKKQTGYVGLRNQGATCYMNSLIQTIFFTNQLRHSVYQMPTECDDCDNSVTLALQRIFYELQFSTKPIGTKMLTKSFGWDTLDSFMPHDVQEFLRVLLDKIESKMKGTNLEKIIPNLFVGKMLSFIRCKNVDYYSSRTETFYDIQLNIKNKKNIYESFKDYIATEVLENDNKYEAGQYGLQDAEKGVIFNQFPPVLHLHLMRFHYDRLAENSMKFNDRFEFYETINLDQFLQTNENQSDPADYTLHAVLVHSGDNHGGHYLVYINVDCKGKWYKFDDDVVTISTNNEAIEQNYGGGLDGIISNKKSCSSAYMLSYIRTKDIPTILREISESDIPDDLNKRLQNDKKLEEIKRYEKYNENFITIHVVLEEYFENHDSVNLFDPQQIPYKVFNIKTSMKLQELLETFAESFQTDLEKLHIWSLFVQNNIVRFVYFDYTNLMDRCLQGFTKNIKEPWVIFLKFVDPFAVPPFDPKENVLVFYKYYEPNGKHLNYIGSKYYLWRTSKINNLIQDVRRVMNIDENLQLNVYDEQTCTQIPHCCYDDTLEKCLKHKLNQSDQSKIMVFEKYEKDLHTIGGPIPSPADSQSQTLPQQQQQQQPIIVNNSSIQSIDTLQTSFQNYLNEILYQIKITFIDKFDQDNEDNYITVSFPENYLVNDMIIDISKKLNTHLNTIKFYKLSNNNKSHTNIELENDSQQQIKYLFMGNRTRSLKKIFYEKLTMDINEYDNKWNFRIMYLPINFKDEKELILYVNKNGKIENLLDEAKKHIQFSTTNSAKLLRFTEIFNYRLIQIYDNNTDLEKIKENWNTTQFRIEEICKNELIENDNEMLIPVSHFNKNITNLHGIPFFVHAIQNQTYQNLVETIRKKLNISVSDWTRNFKYAFVTTGVINYITPDCTDCVDFKHFKLPNSSTYISYIGLDHCNKISSRSQFSCNVEKAIKIYN